MGIALKTAFESFAETAGPVLNIQDETHYGMAMELVEELMGDDDEDMDAPMSALIGILGKAIAVYESSDGQRIWPEDLAFDDAADVAMLRLLMDQHGLGVADFPEIGDKSLVSRILSGQRNLTKKHIARLSKRFDVEPGLFFE
jgi:HTH-type transcriptional regulator/antitoxin HigA